VTDEEIVEFLGVILNMSMNPKPEIQDYFTEEWTQKYSFYKDVFSREIFFSDILDVSSWTNNQEACSFCKHRNPS
jgi:hypothetical protein